MKPIEMINTKCLYYEIYHFLYLFLIVAIYPLLILIAIVLKLIKVFRNLHSTKDIRGQTAVVTGSGRGLGREIAKKLAAKGCHIAVVDVQEKLAVETAQHVADTYHVKTKAYKVDVRDYEQLLQLRDAVTSDLGTPTILINNAAFLLGSSLKNPSPQEIKQMVDVNFTALCYTQRIFLPKMKEINQGFVVNICSLCALIPAPLLETYSATKAAVRSLTSTLRMEFMLEGKNITATTVMPTFLSTNKRCEETVILTGLDKCFPLVEGEIVAKYVIEGMLNGSREITVPSAMLYLYQLVEVLPISVKELLTSLIVAWKYKTIINSEKIAKVLKKSDLND